MSRRAVSKVKSVFAFGAFVHAPGFLSLRVGLPESGCIPRSAAKRLSASRRPAAPSPRFHASITRRNFLATTLSLPAVLLPELVTAKTSAKSAYSIVASKDGAPLALDKFSGKVTLFVNVATYCTLTPQYEGLVSLFEKFEARGFEIIASPCDQFGHQEPGSNDEICKFAKEKFGARFLLLDKLNVNDGPGGVSPLYQFLRDTSPENPGQRVGWNFEKFLVGSDGRVLRRYKPGVLPEQIDEDIGWALQHLGKDLPPKKKPSLGVI